MSPRELFQELRRRGVDLYLVEDKLRYSAPLGAITPDLLLQIAKHRVALVEVVAGACSDCGMIDAPVLCVLRADDGRRFCGPCARGQ